jgi:squalene-hopene/tetraprenyl-beta-curcumene cyclase
MDLGITIKIASSGKGAMTGTRRPAPADAFIQLIAALALLMTGCSPSSSSLQWNPAAAAGYLDHRAQVWIHSRMASRDHGTACLSCHTTLPYALARSELRGVTNERIPPDPQRELLEMVRKRVTLWPQLLPWYRDSKLQSRGTEAVLNAVVLADADALRGHLSPTTRVALDEMWALQRTEGPDEGAWPWIEFHNEPWEAPDSVYYGATLAALATGLAPDGYSREEAVQRRVARLRDYLQREFAVQPLLNRVGLLWAAGELPDLIDARRRVSTLSEIFGRQRADGGWSTVMLMPNWKRRDGSALVEVSDGYATGFVAWVLQESGIPASDSRLQRSLAWLRNHQSRWNGRWSAESLNRHHGFFEESGHFMDDAATAFAVLALIKAQPGAAANPSAFPSRGLLGANVGNTAP